jgi:hypothetical protein
MPIQNVGTLLENLIVTEAALALLDECQQDNVPFDFVNSFAMPPCTCWRPNNQNTGFNAETLERVRTSADPTSLQGYAGLLQANLRADRGLGPNAALLVAGAALQRGIHCRMWLNDIRDGYYGDAIPELERVESWARRIYQTNEGRLSVEVSERPYPDSIFDLTEILRKWQTPPRVRLAFLDPMQYAKRMRRAPRSACETSSRDHRRWLAEIAFDGLTCAVHFATNERVKESPSPQLRSLHEDAMDEHYDVSLAFQRQDHAVFVAVKSRRTEESKRVAGEIEASVQQAWDCWGTTFAQRRPQTWNLTVYRGARNGLELAN